MRLLLFILLLALPTYGGQSDLVENDEQWDRVPEEQIEALLDFYRSTGGADWKDNSGWMSAVSPCEWKGIICGLHDEEEESWSTVEVIDLTDNGLKGTIPSSIASLPDLKSLDLSMNALEGGIPPSITTLQNLKNLNFDENKLEGEVPEEILIRWDNYKLVFRGNGNNFSNMVVRTRLEHKATVLCSENEDLRYVLEINEQGRAKFESVRCTPNTERDTHCLVREGRVYDLGRFSRALARLNFTSLPKEYFDPFMPFVTDGTTIETTAWWGDGSSHIVEAYNKQGSIGMWIAQNLFISFLNNTYWEREYTKPKCDEIK